MTEVIIPILNNMLHATHFFNEQFELCELIKNESGTRPMQYTSLGEYIPVTDFDKSNGVNYWRKNGRTTVSELTTGTVSSNKFVKVSIPLRLVAVINRGGLQNDNSYNSDNLGKYLYKVLAVNLNGQVRETIGARRIVISVESIEDNREDILKVEIGDAKKLDTKYVVAAINLSIQIEIQQSCIDGNCNPLTPCESLLASLSEHQKNTCILPSYDFADSTVYENLTDEQREDLIALLCTGGGGCDEIVIQDTEDYTQTITCAESPYTIADRQIEVFVEGVSQGVVSVPALSDNTINIVWN